MFKRRDRRSVGRTVFESVWPRGGWGRAAQYVRHRLRRLPDSPERIARGVMAGVFTTFTPFYGLHFFLAVFLAWVLRGNIVAALLGTFFGNPLTYVPIGVIALQTGHFLLGSKPPSDEHHLKLTQKFVAAGHDLWDNLVALFTGGLPHWDGLLLFYDDVFFPYLIGGIIPGIVCAVASYFVSLPLIAAYQKRRRARIARKAAALAERQAALQAAASTEQDKLRMAREKARATAAAVKAAAPGKKSSNPA